MAQLASFTSSSLLLGLGLVGACTLGACGTTPPPTTTPTDAGPDTYVAPDAWLPPDSCDMAEITALEGMAGGTVSVDFDTRMTATRPRDLGNSCGNTAADIRWAAQEVVAFHVPGTGMQGVHFSTSNTMTQIDFNTLIQIREGNCRAVPTASFPPTCFDDVSQTNLAAEGGITVMGGTTLFFFITGYSHPPAGEMAVDEGTVHVDFMVAPNTPPVLVSGVSAFSGVDTIVEATATDAEGPIAGFSIGFVNAMGRIDINGDGAANGDDVLVIGFDTVDRAAPMYTGHALISGTTEYALANYCHQAAVACTQIVLRVFDQSYAVSNEIMVAAADAPFVGIGETCDALHLCPPGLNCTGGSCAVIPGATAECSAAGEFALTLPTTTATQSYVTGTVGSGAGVFQASCAATPGREQIWHLTVPAGTWDLALTTAVTGTATTADTVLSLRGVCADQSTELPMGCNDDIDLAGRNYRSAVSFRDIAPGEYWALVEAFGSGGATPYTLQATLTPVLASGAACDPAMSGYRCATGTCGATSHVCP
jgi:hypothetical protein